MATLGSLIISLEANTAKFESAMTKAEYAAKKASDNIVGAFKILGASLAAAFSVSSLDAAFDRITKAESDLLKMATRLNTNVETLSSFSVMIRKTGMDADAFYTTLTRMDKGLSAAALGAEQATGKYDENGEEIQKTAKAYDELGIKASELIKLPLQERLLAIATAMKENIAPQDQVRIAMELGGKSAAGMVNAFREGGDSMQKWIDKGRELGVITTDMAGRAAAARSAAADLSLAWENFARQLVDFVAPAITKVLNLLIALATSKTTTLQIAVETVWEHGEVPQEAFVGPPTPAKLKIPPEVFKPPERQKPTAAKGGGGGAGDMGLSQMQSIIDTLQKDIARFTEGSLAEVREWANHLRNEIAKIGEKGADTSIALTLVDKAEKLKMGKTTKDYYLSVARESGDTYKVIDAEMKDWLIKNKGQMDAEVNYNKIKNRKIAEEDNRQMSEKLGLQKSLLDSIGSELPYISQQLEMKKKLLPIESELARLTLERTLATLKLTDTEKDYYREMLKIYENVKKSNLALQEQESKGTMAGWAFARTKQIESDRGKNLTQIMSGTENFFQNALSSGIQGVLTKDKNNLKQIGKTMMTGFIGELNKRSVTRIFDKLGEMMSPKNLAASDIEGGTLKSYTEGLKKAGDSLQNSALGFDVNATEFGLAASGLLLSGIGIATNSQFLTTAGMVLQAAAMALEVAVAAMEISSFLGLHSGGVIQAHRGWPKLAYDEVPIIAQTGERILSRRQNREYEKGMMGGRGGDNYYNNTNVTIQPRYPMSRQETEHMVRNKLMPALFKQQKRMAGRVP